MSYGDEETAGNNCKNRGGLELGGGGVAKKIDSIGVPIVERS